MYNIVVISSQNHFELLFCPSEQHEGLKIIINSLGNEGSLACQQFPILNFCTGNRACSICQLRLSRATNNNDNPQSKQRSPYTSDSRGLRK